MSDYQVRLDWMMALTEATARLANAPELVQGVLRQIDIAYEAGLKQGLAAVHAANTLEGGRFGLSADLTNRVIAELKAGRKIQAIKLVRQETQLGLKEAKELVEKFPEFGPF